ncbi:hypothetical protein NC653_011499 [Populus alba x Populus x berolinensis]|uniref:Uncharacterized protein n=1 Tax=Populus alba x Populus x berolinensis TaxID=444605 RepID=A0AAD6R2S5_9ROSI|nr:hypothetical protein NC653_011499 [Populus alba x Populus x berolinensis]
MVFFIYLRVKRPPEDNPSQIFWHLAQGTRNWDCMHDHTLHNFQHQNFHQQ